MKYTTARELYFLVFRNVSSKYCYRIHFVFLDVFFLLLLPTHCSSSSIYTRSLVFCFGCHHPVGVSLQNVALIATSWKDSTLLASFHADCIFKSKVSVNILCPPDSCLCFQERSFHHCSFQANGIFGIDQITSISEARHCLCTTFVWGLNLVECQYYSPSWSTVF